MARSSPPFRVAAAAALLSSAACATEGPTDAPPPDPVAVQLGMAHTIQTPVSDSILIVATVVDAEGRLVLLPMDRYRWTTSDASVVALTPRISRNGIVAALATTSARGGRAWISAEVQGVGRDSVPLETFTPGDGPVTITLLFAESVPQLWRVALEDAAHGWEDVIRGQLPEVGLDTPGGDCLTPSAEPPSPPLTWNERGVLIYVGTSGQFPPGTYVEAVGGPCLQRPLPRPTTILGGITINRDHPPEGIPADRLRYVAAHEMGHALGLVGVVQGEQPGWHDFRLGAYTGAMAIEGWRRETGEFVDVLRESGGHWDVYGSSDIMAARGCGCVIGPLSIGGLMDLGYPAVWPPE